MVVLDASLMVELLLKTPLGLRSAAAILSEEIHAPHLIDIEFTHVLRRLVRHGFDAAIADQALDNLREWNFARHDHRTLLPRIWQLRNSISSYDATYIALAEGLHASLLTCDAKLSRSHGHNARIEVLS